MTKQACEAMQFIANEGVVHRDLAARNILLFSKLDATDPSSVNVKVCTRTRVKSGGPSATITASVLDIHFVSVLKVFDVGRAFPL